VDELEARLCRAIARTSDAEAREVMLDALFALRRARWSALLAPALLAPRPHGETIRNQRLVA